MPVEAVSTASIDRAAAALRAGRLVAFPTETVYGLGADASNPRAVAEVFAVKGRPRFNPLIVHVPDLAAAALLAELDDSGRRLAASFWPGALTLVLPRRADSGIAELTTAGLGTLAVRVPAHPVASALLRAADRPIAAPSANRSGHVSPTTAAHVAAAILRRSSSAAWTRRRRDARSSATSPCGASIVIDLPIRNRTKLSVMPAAASSGPASPAWEGSLPVHSPADSVSPARVSS